MLSSPLRRRKTPRSISRLAAGILVVPLIFAACGRGTSPAPEQATTAAAPNSQVLMQLRSDWQAQKDTMMKIADAMPENKFGYKSTPAQRNYGEQIMHVASSNVELLKVLGGNAAAPGFTAESAKTKADILKALGDSYDYGTALMNELSETTVLEQVKDSPSFLGPSSRARILWTLLAHSMDIYGQMAVYLRLNGIVPPASRGV
jgi:uncharacterized damage-inducible protein DinB